jgi:hypothetical protein
MSRAMSAGPLGASMKRRHGGIFDDGTVTLTRTAVPANTPDNCAHRDRAPLAPADDQLARQPSGPARGRRVTLMVCSGRFAVR